MAKPSPTPRENEEMKRIVTLAIIFLLVVPTLTMLLPKAESHISRKEEIETSSGTLFIRYVHFDDMSAEPQYDFDETIVVTVEVDTTQTSQNVDLLVVLYDPDGNQWDWDDVPEYTTYGSSNDPKPLYLSTYGDLDQWLYYAGGTRKWRVRVIVADADTHRVEDEENKYFWGGPRLIRHFTCKDCSDPDGTKTTTFYDTDEKACKYTEWDTHGLYITYEIVFKFYGPAGAYSTSDPIDLPPGYSSYGVCACILIKGHPPKDDPGPWYVDVFLEDYFRVKNNFEIILTTCKLTILVEGTGTTSPSPTTYTYDCCTTVTVTAVETNTCWRFDHWVLDGSPAGSINPYNIHMDKDHTLIAVFEKIVVDYTIATNPSGLKVIIDGTTYTAPKTFTWECGSSHTIYTTSPQGCYKFDCWSDGGAQSHTIIVGSSSKTITAYFAKLRFKLTIQVSGTGTTDPLPGIHERDCSTDVMVTAKETDPCWMFDHWELDGTNVGSADPITVHMDKDHILKAVFEMLPTDLTVSSMMVQYDRAFFYANVTDGCHVDVNITNIGNADAGPFNVTFSVTWIKGMILEYSKKTLISGLLKGATIGLHYHFTIEHVGNYSVAAMVDSDFKIPESNEDNNTLTRIVTGRGAGDTNGDGKVDYRDLFPLARAYGSKISAPSWDPDADINCDGIVDYRDLFLLAKNYGKTFPDP